MSAILADRELADLINDLVNGWDAVDDTLGFTELSKDQEQAWARAQNAIASAIEFLSLLLMR